MKSKKNGTYSLICSPISTWKEKYGNQLSTALNNVIVLLEEKKLLLNE